jgi:hypothetical protein
MTGLWRRITRITSWFAHPLRLATLGVVVAVGAGLVAWSTVGSNGRTVGLGHPPSPSPRTSGITAKGDGSSPTSTAPGPRYAAASGGSSETPATGGTATSAPPTTPAPGRTIATTTSPPPPPCTTSAFVPSVSTDRTSYAVGQPVTITTTVTNTGPSCTEDEQAGFTCPGAYVDDASGQLVWTSAPEPSTGCAARTGPPTVLPSGWSEQTQYLWQQDACTGGAGGCSHDQVPPGEYRVVGTNWSQASAPVTVSITPAGPGSTTTTT